MVVEIYMLLWIEIQKGLRLLSYIVIIIIGNHVNHMYLKNL
jgi:hypothetical protein